MTDLRVNEFCSDILWYVHCFQSISIHLHSLQGNGHSVRLLRLRGSTANAAWKRNSSASLVQKTSTESSSQYSEWSLRGFFWICSWFHVPAESPWNSGWCGSFGSLQSLSRWTGEAPWRIAGQAMLIDGSTTKQIFKITGYHLQVWLSFHIPRCNMLPNMLQHWEALAVCFLLSSVSTSLGDPGWEVSVAWKQHENHKLLGPPSFHDLWDS